MSMCSRCGRPHTGICGIPGGVTRGFGARTGSPGTADSYDPNAVQGKRGRPAAPAQTLAAQTEIASLEGMLADGEGHYQKIIELLMVLPQDNEETEALLEKESELVGTLEALRLKLAGIMALSSSTKGRRKRKA